VCGKLGRAVGRDVMGGRQKRHAWPIAAERGKAGAAFRALKAEM